MKDFVFWRTETDVYKTYFKAESLEQAEKQLNRVRNGEIDVSDLLSFDSVGKDFEQEIAIDTLEEI